MHEHDHGRDQACSGGDDYGHGAQIESVGLPRDDAPPDEVRRCMIKISEDVSHVVKDVSALSTITSILLQCL